MISEIYSFHFSITICIYGKFVPSYIHVFNSKGNSYMNHLAIVFSNAEVNSYINHLPIVSVIILHKQRMLLVLIS